MLKNSGHVRALRYLVPIHVIGAGLAGSEAAWQIARQHASRNSTLAQTPALRTGDEHHLEVMKTADWIIGLVPKMRTAEGSFRKGRPSQP